MEWHKYVLYTRHCCCCCCCFRNKMKVSCKNQQICYWWLFNICWEWFLEKQWRIVCRDKLHTLKSVGLFCVCSCSFMYKHMQVIIFTLLITMRYWVLTREKYVALYRITCSHHYASLKFLSYFLSFYLYCFISLFLVLGVCFFLLVICSLREKLWISRFSVFVD